MGRIEKWVKNASSRLEFLVVILVAFGYLIVGSLFLLLFPSRRITFTGEGLIFLLAYEIIVCFALGWLLQKRGWTLAKLGFKPSWKSTLIGVGIVPAFYLIYALVWNLVILWFPELQPITKNKVLSASGVGLWQIILISIINPIFEEFFVCGYIINFLKKSNKFWVAVIVSTTVRTLYHLYQPLLGIVSIAAIGLVFGLIFAKTNRLWAVIVAHSIFDFLGFFRLIMSNS